MSMIKKTVSISDLGLNAYTENTLLDAGIRTSDDLLVLGVIVLQNLKGLGCICAEETVFALFNTITDKSSYVSIDPLYEKNLDNIDTLIYVDRTLVRAGYSNEDKLVKMSIREFLSVAGIGKIYCDLFFRYIAETYNSLYVVPDNISFNSRDDLIKNYDSFFKDKRLSKETCETA